MIGDSYRVDFIDQLLELAKMLFIQLVGRAEGHSDPVAADGVVVGNIPELLAGR